MNDKKKLIYSIITVLLLGLIVSGSSFAYFQWSSGVGDRANVDVTIEQSGITMHIEPETTTMTNLRPTNNCNNAVAYGDALVTIVNNTGAMAIPSFKLSAKVAKNGTEELDSDDLKHIHYSVVLLETNIKNGSKGPNTLNDGACNNPSNFTVTNQNLYFTGTTGSATGTFETVSTNGEWSDLPNTSGTYLPRQFNTETVTPYGVTLLGKPHSTSYQWFRVYVWMDEGYTVTNIGGVVSDPLQNAKIEVTWSTNSTIQQVSSKDVGGVSSKAAGLYDDYGNFTSWDTLIANGDITVENDGTVTSNITTESGDDVVNYKNLMGELIIPEGITSIKRHGFEESLLTSVVIPDSVTWIGDYAFLDSPLTSVVIGNSVEYIGSDSFGQTYLTSVVIPKSVTEINFAFEETPLTDIYYVGTEEEWNAIETYDYYDPLANVTIHYNYQG